MKEQGLSKLLSLVVPSLERIRALVKTMRHGGEFTSIEMAQLCVKMGIKQEFANIGTPSENGVVERKN